jgi:hypothetical protein
MTLTTEVRINWPVPAVRLLDVATMAAGGDPAAVERDEDHPSPVWNMSWVRNRPDQGLAAYLHVRWTEQPDEGMADCPEPPALVILVIDTPEGTRGRSRTGQQVTAEVIVPPVREWLDSLDVPRRCWWWEDELKGSFHPGSTDIAALCDPAHPRETWTCFAS